MNNDTHKELTTDLLGTVVFVKVEGELKEGKIRAVYIRDDRLVVFVVFRDGSSSAEWAWDVQYEKH
jgi:hypothetical protein